MEKKIISSLFETLKKRKIYSYNESEKIKKIEEKKKRKIL
jgi:hypothetical protein